MKNKNKFNLKITAVAVSLLAFNAPAHAQLATFDAANLMEAVVTYVEEAYSAAKGALTAAQTAISAEQNTLTSGYTYLTSRAAASTGQKVAQNTEAVNLGTNQSIKNVESASLNNRKALGDAEMGRTAMSMLPTLAMCAEASKSDAKAAVASSGMRGAGGGNSNPAKRALDVTTVATAQANLLLEKPTLGTCSAETAGTQGCTGDGAYAGADMHPKGIKGDSKGSKSSDDTKPAFHSNTLDDTAWKVALKYASDMSYNDKPKVATSVQMAKNPSYAALYQSMQTKLNAANDAVVDIAKMRRASSSDITASIAGQEWSKVSATDYTKITGLATKPQKTPSLFDMLNYQVRNDYFGNKDAKLDSIDEVNKRLASLNFIAWQQYQQQENTNLLLSHLLVQMTTPISKAQVDNEFAKTMNIK